MLCSLPKLLIFISVAVFFGACQESKLSSESPAEPAETAATAETASEVPDQNEPTNEPSPTNEPIEDSVATAPSDLGNALLASPAPVDKFPPVTSVPSSGRVDESSKNMPGKCICDPEEARNIARLLVLSNPTNELDPAQFRAFQDLVSSNAQLLGQRSPSLECARRLGQAFQARGLAQFKSKDYKNAYQSVLDSGGSVDMAQDVASGMNSGAMDTWMTGRELVWLAEVIPPAAAGDWTPYLTTGTESRQQFRQVLSIYSHMDMNDMLPIISQSLVAMQPYIEEQMVLAACLFDK